MDSIESLLFLETEHSNVDRSLSPIYSNFGLCFSCNEARVDKLALHYNRKTRILFESFITFADKGNSSSVFLSSRFTGENACFELSFYDTDAFCVSGKTDSPVYLFQTAGEGLSEIWEEYADGRTLVLRGYSKNGDDRDPDEFVPVMIGVKVQKGSLYTDGRVKISPDENGETAFSVVLSVFDVSAEKTLEALSNAPECINSAKAAVRRWAQSCAGGIKNVPNDENTRKTFLTAVSGLLMNLTKAPGALSGYVSSFPSRGGYPTHFMWDSAFQNLAYEVMDEKTACDSIMQLAFNMRPDGKIPQFICSTWARPHHAQPALLGWAAERYARRMGENNLPDGFARAMYDVLSKNNLWWLNQRMTKFGLIYCPHGLETGQDDSPRFDGGETMAVDMNSYLLSQMKSSAYFARLIGDPEGEALWNRRAEGLSSLIIKYLYDKEKNLFFDADKKTGEKLPLVSLSAFLPLWAGVGLPKEKSDSMIMDYLLNKEYFFGSVPFPSVSYSEGSYEHDRWWRGPTWMPMAWLMLETLQRYGFEKERNTAAERLFSIMQKDGVLHELFDSQTGKGLGEEEQGWTAAIFIRMFLDKTKEQ